MDLSVTLTAAPDPVVAGQSLTYTMTVTNDGPDVAANVQVLNTMPLGTAIGSFVAPGWTVTLPPTGNGTIESVRASLPVGSSVFTMVFPVDTDFIDGAVLTHGVAVTSSTTDSDPLDNTFGLTTTVATLANLSITKTDAPDPVVMSENITYTITATNAGPSNAFNVDVVDNWPPSANFVSLSPPPGWVCQLPPISAPNSLTCNLVSLAPGSAVFTLVLQASAVPGSILTNSVAITSATSDPPPGPEIASTTTTVSGVPVELLEFGVE